MDIPGKDVFGNRMTVNSMLGTDQAVWHFRAGWNVAALNCMRPEHAPILDAYGAMLREESATLSAANTAVDRMFREQQEGDRRAALLARETQSTALYNYFATPPARRYFCATALEIANEYINTPPADFQQFALTGLQRYESAFDQFFTDYEAYQTASAEWDARYGAQYGQSQPGWIALYGTPAQRLAAGLPVEPLMPADPVAVPDEDTGATIPVIPVQEDSTRQPVVQPLPGETIVLPPPEQEEDEASR